MGVHVPLLRAAGLTLAVLLLCDRTAVQATTHPDKLEILAMLESRDFARLDRLLSDLQDKADRDVREEADVQLAFEAFAISRAEIEPLLEEWVRSAPKSYAANLALATHLSHRAWKARGGKFAGETSSEQFAQMNQHFARAVEGASAAIALHPTLMEAYSLLVNVAMARGEPEREAELVKRALATTPATFRVRRTAMQSLRPRWGGSYEAMQLFAQDSLRHAGKNPKLQILVGMASWDMGTAAVANKNYGAAVALFTKALEAGPYDQFYASRADAHLRMNAYAQALADANEALRLKPQDAKVLSDRARGLGGAGHIEVAVADVELAAKLAPDDTSVTSARSWLTGRLVHAGCELQKRGNYDEALARFDQAVKLDPENAEAFYWRGYTYVQKGRLGDARHDLEHAISLNPRYFDAYKTLDWVLGKEGHLDDVIASWDRFIALEPANANAYLERAGTYRHKGDMTAAMKDVKTSCDLGNGNACEIFARQAPR